jgi:hypothetical protein
MRISGLNKFRVGNSGVGSGNAQPSEVLSPKTFSNDNLDGAAGTMSDMSGQTLSNQSLSGGNLQASYFEFHLSPVSAGFVNTLTKFRQRLTNLISANLKTGVSIPEIGVSGSFTSDATAVASEVLSSKKAYVNGALVVGTMPNNAAPTATITNQNGTVNVPAGYSPGGTITASISNLTAGVIKKDAVVGGITGTFSDALKLTPGNNVIWSANDPNNDFIADTTAGLGAWGLVANSGLQNKTINYPGTVRVEFSAVSADGEIAVYKNGVIVSDIIRLSTSLTTYTRDIAVNAGDVLSLWGRMFSDYSYVRVDWVAVKVGTALFM